MRTINSNRSAKVMCISLAVLALGASVSAYPPDPDNAALLYYQVYLMYPQPDDATKDMVDQFTAGKIGPNDQIRQYIESCRTAIDYATAAADLQHCNWGLRYSKGFAACFPHLAQARQVSRILVAKARLLAADGAHQQAFEQCLTVLKMSRHVGDETLVSLLVSMAIRRMANDCTRDILAEMPADLEMLTWLRNEVASIPSWALSVKAPVKTEVEIVLESMRLENVDELIEALDPETDKEAALDQLVELGGETFLAKNRDYYAKHMASVQAILDSAMPYAHVYEELQKLSDKPAKDMAQDPAATLTAAVAPAISKVYTYDIRAKTHSNAIKAAIDIYILKAKTGALPDVLPAGLPNDLFSGKDFGYEKTGEGFVLHCLGKDLGKDEIHSYEFTVLP